jgi:hypothetical protein
MQIVTVVTVHPAQQEKNHHVDYHHGCPGEDILCGGVAADLQLLVVVAGARPHVPSVNVRCQVNHVDACVGIEARHEADVNIDGHAGDTEGKNQDVLLAGVPYTEDAEQSGNWFNPVQILLTFRYVLLLPFTP